MIVAAFVASQCAAANMGLLDLNNIAGVDSLAPALPAAKDNHTTLLTTYYGR